MSSNKYFDIKKMVVCAMLAAVAGILMMYGINSAFFPFFLEWELSDIPAAVGTLIGGPVAGIVIVVVKNLIKIVGKGTNSVGVGELANILIGSSYMIALGLMIKPRERFTLKKFIVTGVIATVVMTVVGGVINYFITIPFYTEVYMPLDVILAKCSVTIPIIKSKFDLILFGISPFNLIKGIMISVVTYFVYIGIRKGIKNI